MPRKRNTSPRLGLPRYGHVHRRPPPGPGPLLGSGQQQRGVPLAVPGLRVAPRRQQELRRPRVALRRGDVQRGTAVRLRGLQVGGRAAKPRNCFVCL